MNRVFPQMIAIVAISAAIALGCVATVQGVHLAGNTVSAQTDGAFRDGWYLGRLDANQGRKPHLASGRWSAPVDRQSFVYAYLQAYREAYQASNVEPRSFQMAGERGYRDGVADGLQQRDKAGVFHIDTDNYQKADDGYSDAGGDRDQYRRVYREAYCNGYQEGYYGPVQGAEASNFGDDLDWQ